MDRLLIRQNRIEAILDREEASAAERFALAPPVVVRLCAQQENRVINRCPPPE